MLILSTDVELRIAVPTIRAIAVVCSLAIGLSGCAGSQERSSDAVSTTQTGQNTEAPNQNSALDAYVAAEEETFPALMESAPGVYSEISAKAKYPGTVQFVYRYADPVDPTAAAEHFEQMISTLQDGCDTVVFPAMRTYGVVEDLHVEYVYYNSDGSELWKKTFAPS